MKRKNICMAYICALSVIAVSLAIPQTPYAQEQEFKEHTVVRGETLWTISSKEIVDPFLWPKIWKENPDIKNPDLIYPGEKVRIPLSLLQKEGSPQSKATAAPESMSEGTTERKAAGKTSTIKITPVAREYFISVDAIVASGYIADSLESKGLITATPTGRTSLGEGDYAYIASTGSSQAEAGFYAGEKFYIIRPSQKVKHPATGAMMGYLIDVVGVAEVIGKESGMTKARITASFSDVETGDLLNPYYEIERPFLTEEPTTKAVKGYIVASKEAKDVNGQFSIVYIDKGARDGIEVGDMLNMTALNSFAVPNGSIQIIAVKEKTATALVRTSQKEVTVGDRIGDI